MRPGSASQADQSASSMPPSTWNDEVAVPQRNPSGKQRSAMTRGSTARSRQPGEDRQLLVRIDGDGGDRAADRDRGRGHLAAGVEAEGDAGPDRAPLGTH